MCSKIGWLTKYFQKTRYSGKILLPRKKPSEKLFENVKVGNSSYEVNQISPRNIAGATNLMLDIFYNTAPVPSCLGLYKDSIMTPFLRDELDIFLSSGVSIAFQDPSKDDKVFGAGFSFYFEDDDEDKPDVKAEDWHNTAAEYISKTVKPGEEISHLWRNYQLLHLQHYCQKVIRQEKASFGIHKSQLALEEAYRGGSKDGAIPQMFEKMSRQIWDKNGVITTVSNFPAFSRFLENQFAGHIRLVDQVPYRNLKLRGQNGELVFESLDNLGTIDYYALVKSA